MKILECQHEKQECITHLSVYLYKNITNYYNNYVQDGFLTQILQEWDEM